MKYTLLEPLRGLAALWVFAFHFPFSETWKQAFPTFYALCRLGDLGVPMFFVISGFCIAASARSTLRKSEPTGPFLYRRVRRIYPPYWFSILVVASLPFVIELFSALKTGQYIAPTSTHLNYGFLNYSGLDWLRVATLIQVFVPMPEASSLQYKFTTLNAVYWTLAIEVQFYLLISCAVLMRRFFYRLLVVVTMLSLPLSFLPSTYVTGIFLPYWPMFAVGVFIFYLFEKGYTPSQLLGRRVVWLSALLVMVSCLGFLWYALQNLPMSSLGFALFFGVMIYAAEGLEAPFSQALSSRLVFMRYFLQLLMVLGAMSYSLYLLHGRMQFLSMQMSRQIFASNTIAHDLGAIVLTTLSCYLFYLLCEKPFMGSRNLRPAKEAPTPVANATATA